MRGYSNLKCNQDHHSPSYYCYLKQHEHQHISGTYMYICILMLSNLFYPNPDCLLTPPINASCGKSAPDAMKSGILTAWEYRHAPISHTTTKKIPINTDDMFWPYP